MVINVAVVAVQIASGRYFDEKRGDPRRIYNSNSLSIMTRLVATAVGVGALPRVLVDGIIKSGEARILDITPSVPPLTFHTVYQERGDNALARAIADMATEIVSETTIQWMTAAA